MDAVLHQNYLKLLTWTGTRTVGLGDLLREYPDPTAAITVSDARLEKLPPATQARLHEARRQWPRRGPYCVAFAQARAQAKVRARAQAQAQTEAQAQAEGTDEFLPLWDERYPRGLRNIPDPPPWLFCRGCIASLEKPTVAIVGSRRASHAGLTAAALIAEHLAAAGYVVCSGLALGIDAAAHRGALQTGLTTAVLASGLDRASPTRHRDLFAQITGQGCALTELPPGTPPDRHQFPRRNRIISGLADSTIIVEAALPSGSLHTAAAALEQGRDVYVLPWSIFHSRGAGCLSLLRDGATPLTAIEELADYFPALDAVRADVEPLPGGLVGDVLCLIGDGRMSTEQLLGEIAVSVGELLRVLGEMEIDGWLEVVDGLYQRCARRSS